MGGARHKFARPGKVEVQDGTVRMTAERGIRLRHASDTPGEMGVAFGGDTMGHWNVDRVNRMLDAFDAPVRQMVIPQENMVGMARAGAPDIERAAAYARLGIASMPPVSFVCFPAIRNGEIELTTLLVDGHHRLLALAMLDAPTVPARVLPPTLADDVRIVEMGEFATFPEPTFAGKRVVTG